MQRCTSAVGVCNVAYWTRVVAWFETFTYL